MIPVNIKEKACQRVFKRGVAKVEVWSKGGFLRGDTLLGTASGIANTFNLLFKWTPLISVI